MPTYPGFYLSPQAWDDWVRSQNTLLPRWGPGNAEDMIKRELRKHKMKKYFAVIQVPTPLSEPGESSVGLMIYRQCSPRRVYLAPHADAKADVFGPQILQSLIGVTTSEWRCIWFKNYSTKPRFEAEFLEPPSGGQDGGLPLQEANKGLANTNEVAGALQAE
ncbi:hypothetical protein RhiXN_10940 [Rhizoctonia solani]|uniref:Uncharacterized protein n=1 Tax=Rhizoctonia solani TaxID=456999 RepID=A0A8H8P622_9AGAM|nr:uncharacterized protein RhiXN_10927 [Rhizoctonia solani]XP_043186100.1 uncharacterized protein RhiXN_10940 [Rhizoctonia solani]QRW25850.1 hypothetical protein RhiXN_10927 [Rhizoctonia solani]QRW25863.1 hypothetical protein RhiXN_10940 [Rhizoctonia solani]